VLLKGCAVTLGAMGCQRKTAAKIADIGTDCVISPKGNQSVLHRQSGARIPMMAPCV